MITQEQTEKIADLVLDWLHSRVNSTELTKEVAYVVEFCGSITEEIEEKVRLHLQKYRKAGHGLEDLIEQVVKVFTSSKEYTSSRTFSDEELKVFSKGEITSDTDFKIVIESLIDPSLIYGKPSVTSVNGRFNYECTVTDSTKTITILDYRESSFAPLSANDISLGIISKVPPGGRIIKYDHISGKIIPKDFLK